MTHHSRYNHTVAVPDSDDCLVYNFNTGAMLKLSPAQKVLFDLSPQFSQDHPVVRRWRELGFLADRDELEDLKEQMRKRYDGYAGRADKVLRLTLHVTSACNFACPYCFQRRRGGHMPKEVQDQVVRFAQAKLAQGGYERMTVDWFGGEPLLAADIIDCLGHRLMDAAARRGAGFSSNIQTNGYLLSGGTAVAHVPNHFLAVVGYDPREASYRVIESKVSLRRRLRQDSWVAGEKLSSGPTCVDWYALLASR